MKTGTEQFSNQKHQSRREINVYKEVSVMSARSSLSDVCSSVTDQFGLNQLFDDIKTGRDVMIDS